MERDHKIKSGIDLVRRWISSDLHLNFTILTGSTSTSTFTLLNSFKSSRRNGARNPSSRAVPNPPRRVPSIVGTMLCKCHVYGCGIVADIPPFWIYTYLISSVL